jgi:hypothetical protein
MLNQLYMSDIIATGLGLTGPSGPSVSTGSTGSSGKQLSIIGATGIVTLDNSDPLSRQRIIVIRTAAAPAAEGERRDLWQTDEEQQLSDRRAILGETQKPPPRSRRYKVTAKESADAPPMDRRYALSANRQLNTLLLQHELNGMSISDIKATGTTIVGQIINTDKETIGLLVRNGKTTNYISTKRQTLDSKLPIMGIVNKTQSSKITTVKTSEAPAPSWWSSLF